ncbi:ATP-dependent RNA helicase HrpA [Parathalassolituus penaei]|uniref:ATP-dependent RNA helicase HrpA n=1 Tax=Parathalassolituus penaei TaxID=2997323 RepID=A0A9X3EHD7_9GAMM|nr:ATP-dependent RNA helicase HrpA [Parathalassolituus penaei]MCY0966745.1 ATP-dependent RNA helicase HrpA [Parathalassolituus penaei]
MHSDVASTASAPSPELDRQALHRAIDHCLIKDRHRLRRQVSDLVELHKQQKPLAESLTKLLARIEQSQQQVKLRSEPLRLLYPDLPVSERKDEILEALKKHQVVVVAGETGSGKTTQLPKICIEAGFGRYGRIGHTQPRRLAARAVAQRIADELQVELGTAVGYQVRFTDQSAENTRVKLMTDGILLAQTQHDRFLNEYDVIIIDEAHERSLNIDFLLGYLKQLLPKRPDLKLVITSATIDVERFSQHFDNAPVIQVSGRTFPVEVRYRALVRTSEEEEDRSLFEGIYDALSELRAEDKSSGMPGDVLVFLPGEREIRECAEYLRRAGLPSTEVLPLYARLSAGDQQKIFKPTGGRRVVLATNVAETSLTVPGIRYVVDSGVARISRYSYRSKVQRLPVEAISQASANQRAGRCGRTAPGVCIRLYEESDFQSRDEFTDPEIRRTNLAAVILQMLHLGLGRLQDFPFVDAPDERFIKDGFTLLQELEAVDNKQKMTQIGRQMARLPVDPRLARMMLEAQKQGALKEVLIIAAALTVQDPRERPPEKQQQADEKHRLWADEDSDFAALINLWNAWEETRQEESQSQLRKWCTKHFLNYMRMREWRDIHRQLHLLCKELGLTENEAGAGFEAIHKSLLAGMLSHIGFKGEGMEYLGARNRTLHLFPASSQYKKKPKWMMAAELVETSRLFARMVAKIEPEWIEEIGRPLLKYQYFEPHWDRKRGQVVAFEQSTLYGLIVNPRKRVNYALTHPEEARKLLIQDGLVAQQMDTKVEFLRYNRDLIEEVTEYEEKSRRRDLVIDDNYLVAFYEKHLPADILSTRHLESWYKAATKAQKDALKLTREELLSSAAAGIRDADYPSELEWQGLAFPLSYRFAPGEEDDGVSLSVPVAMLQQVPADQVEWLVPGFVGEKLAAIIKGLPKVVRKLFVPVPNTVDDFLRGASPDKGGLYTQLLAYLNRIARPQVITIEQLRETELTPYFLMNIRVLDGNKLLAQSRHLDTLKAEFSELSQASIQGMVRHKLQRDEVLRWDFGDLPEVTQSEVNGLPVRAFPCLKRKGHDLEVTVEADAAVARQNHRRGLVLLYRKTLFEQERVLKNLIQKKMGAKWLQAKGMGTQQTLTEELLEAMFQHVFVPLDQPLPYEEAEFQKRLELRSQVVPFGEQLLEQFSQWVTLRHKILKDMGGKVSLDRAMAYSDIKANLERLLKTGFMLDASWDRLKCFMRYLKAMEYRIDKLQGNLPRDRLGMVEFASVYEPFVAYTKDKPLDEPSDLTDFRWLLEEWRVSLFAQPLGTQEPVSLKRLEKRWGEIIGQVR